MPLLRVYRARMGARDTGESGWACSFRARSLVVQAAAGRGGLDGGRFWQLGWIAYMIEDLADEAGCASSRGARKGWRARAERRTRLSRVELDDTRQPLRSTAASAAPFCSPCQSNPQTRPRLAPKPLSTSSLHTAHLCPVRTRASAHSLSKLSARTLRAISLVRTGPRSLWFSDSFSLLACGTHSMS